MSKARVLVVDDDQSILKSVSASLRQQQYDVVQAIDGEQALQAAEEMQPDLLVVDITMPKVDGFEVCRRIREWSLVPIIMLSARFDESDKVKALNLGADDYLVKPFGMDELIARVEAVLRRTKARDVLPAEPSFIRGDLEVDFASRRVSISGQEVKLTPTEYNLLRELVLNRGKVLTHRMLLSRVWGPEYGDEREYVHVVVNRLRKKLEPDADNPTFIVTVPGVGYRLQDPQPL